MNFRFRPVAVIDQRRLSIEPIALFFEVDPIPLFFQLNSLGNFALAKARERRYD